MRRKPGRLLTIETALLEAGITLHGLGASDFHGYALAKEMQELGSARTLTAHGTLYKALDRLEAMGVLESDWEDAHLAAAEKRPRRRLYRVTAAGSAALERERAYVRAETPAVMKTEPAQG